MHERYDFSRADIKDMKVSFADERYCTLEYKYGSMDRTLKIGRSLSGSEYDRLYSYGFALYENSRLSCFESWELNETQANLSQQITQLVSRMIRYPVTQHEHGG